MDKVKEVVGKVTGHPKLPTAKLGKNGPHVTRLGYGTMGLVSHHQSLPQFLPPTVTDHILVERLLWSAQARRGALQGPRQGLRRGRPFLGHCRHVPRQRRPPRQVVQAQPRQA
jgi:hypothetical protein